MAMSSANAEYVLIQGGKFRDKEWCNYVPTLCSWTPNRYDLMKGREIECVISSHDGPCLTSESWIQWSSEKERTRSVKPFNMGYAQPCPMVDQRPGCYVTTSDKVLIGRVIQPCMPQCCAKVQLEAYMGNTCTPENLLFTIKSCAINCMMTCGKCYHVCCAPCRELEFAVTDSNGMNKGFLSKGYNGTIKECCSNDDLYHLSFPDEEPQKKLMFLAAIQLLDQLFFETPARI
jgi:hypothetical protein